MSSLLLSKQTTVAIEKLFNNPVHSILIIGKSEAGKKTLAYNLASTLLGLTDDEYKQYAYQYTILPIKNTIGIDQVRKIKELLNLKTTGKGKIRRIIIVADAELMTGEAQNSILKVLEEPPSDTVFILTTSNPRQIRSTVLSRVHILNLVAPNIKETVEYFTALGSSKTDIERNYYLSNGATGQIFKLLFDNKYQLVQYIDEAKKILQQKVYERLMQVDSYSKDSSQLPLKLFALKRISQAALHNAIRSNQQKHALHWYKCLREVQDSDDSLQNGANTKLLITKMFLNM